MIMVFLDSSVLIAAAGSKNGASALILAYCRKKRIEGYTSKYALLESKKNLSLKFDQKAKERFNFIVLKSNVSVVEDLDETRVMEYVPYIPDKDAPILARAHTLNAQFLITLDTKDFMDSQLRDFVKPMVITTPKTFFKKHFKK